MATIVNMHQAKSQLSKLVEKALAGEEVIVARAGKPAVKLVPCEAPAENKDKGLRPIGGLEGKIWMAPDWNDPWPEEFIDLFYRDDPLISSSPSGRGAKAAESPSTYEVAKPDSKP